MLGKLEDSPQLATLTQPDVQEATLVYDPTASAESQFAWITKTKQPYLFVEEAGAIIRITLESKGAVFAEDPFIFMSVAHPFELVHREDNEVLFTVAHTPQSYFDPFLLAFKIDNGAVKNINSSPLYFVLRPSAQDSTSITLQYSTEKGEFSLVSVTEVLESLDLLVNVILPFTITVDLAADPGVTFHPKTPIVGPDWLTISPLTTPTKLVISIPKIPAAFASVQFVLDVNGVKVVSPDPIIVNATIGDGTALQLDGEGGVRT